MSRGYTLVRALRHEAMRRALVTYAIVSVVEFAVYFTVILLAFEAGGTGMAGVAAAAQLAPSVLVPVIIRWIDRGHVPPMRFALWWMFLGLATGGVAVVGGPTWIVIGLAAIRSLAYSLARPIHLAVVPVHAEHTADATAAMVVTGWIDSIGVMLGPAIAGAVLAFFDASAVFVTMSALTLMGLWLSPGTGEVVGTGTGRVTKRLLSVRGVRPMLAYKTASSVLSGATDVIVVLVAIELLGMGDDGAAYLASLVGVGELIGGLLLISVLGRVRLRGVLGVAAFGRGASVSLLGIVPQAFPLLAFAGGFRPVHRVVQRIMIQRITPPDRYMRMFGVTEAFDAGGQALGAALVPVLVAAFGVEPAIVISGALLPLSFVALSSVFRGVDTRAVIPQSAIETLSEVAAFEGLSADVMEYLARMSVPTELAAGEWLIRRGDTEADAAWVVANGEVDVIIDGRPVARLGRPELVGEIALIHQQPRTADVVAVTACEMLRIDHETFLDVVVGGRGGGDHVRVLADRRIDDNNGGQ